MLNGSGLGSVQKPAGQRFCSQLILEKGRELGQRHPVQSVMLLEGKSVLTSKLVFVGRGRNVCVCGRGCLPMCVCVCMCVSSKHILMWSLEETESSGELKG